MRNPLGCVSWTLAFTILVGCASAPQYRYYTLDMRASGKAAPTARLAMVKVDVADALAKPEIMIRTSPTQITYYALDRWASGIGQQLSEKLTTEFANAPADAPAVWIDATLLAFEQVDTPAGAEARVKVGVSAGWYEDGRRAANLHEVYEQSVPAGTSTADDVVAALSRVVEMIAVEIAQEPALQAANYRKSDQK